MSRSRDEYHSREYRDRRDDNRRHEEHNRNRYDSQESERDSRPAAGSSRHLEMINNRLQANPDSNVIKDVENSVKQPETDEQAVKLKRRLERLNAWKLKNAAKSASPALEEKEQQQETPIDEKTALRLKKLEEWKKKKEKKLEDLSKPKKMLSLKKPFQAKLSKTAELTKKTVKTNTTSNPLFDDEEDVSSPKAAPGFKRPLPRKEDVYDSSNESDDLDQYLESLQENVNDITEDSSRGLYIDQDEDIPITEYEDESVSRLLKLKRKNETKSVMDIDHSKVDYESFRKEFYSESPDLKLLSAEDIESIRLTLDGIKIRGKNCPTPILNWPQLGLPATLMTVIEGLGYENPSSIQSQSLPAIMSGRDVIGVAKTGSGKTLSFLLPMIRHIKDQRPLSRNEGPIALILSPTRELAIQILKEAKPFLKALDLKGICAYGGSSIKEQISELKKGVEVVVCTPGRMIDLLVANNGRVTNLERVTYLVLDEADRMFDMGFEPQVMKIIKNIRPERQTVMFSATFPPRMESLAKNILSNPLEIIVGGRSVVAPEITQKVEIVTEDEKFKKLLTYLGKFTSDEPDGKVIIFVDKQTSADDLHVELGKLGHFSFAIHGGRDQEDREGAISDFKSGVVKIMIATSVAARGLDVKGLRLVINYDAPNHLEDYVHRAGRTGRAGTTGTAVTFVRPDQEGACFDLAKAFKLSEVEVPSDLQALAIVYQQKIDQGKEKRRYGFGGKGLDKLEQLRKEKQMERRQITDGNDATASGEGSDKKSQNDNGTPTPSTISQSKLSEYIEDYEIFEGEATEISGPNKSAFHTRININDLPKTARIYATNRDNFAKIVENTSSSITMRGRYYPAGKEPGAGEDPKLYLLIGGATEADVRSVAESLKLLVIEGLEKSSREEKVSSGKYRV